MKRKKLSNWQMLKKCLFNEVELILKYLQRSKKNGDFKSCLEIREQLTTLNWVLEEMNSIEETGKLL
jgi:hypothetical protein